MFYKKTLIYITKSFPFGRNFDFSSDEFIYLKNIKANIIILPCNIREKERNCSLLNVHIIQSLSEINNFKKIKAIFCSLSCCCNIVYELFLNIVLNMKNIFNSDLIKQIIGSYGIAYYTKNVIKKIIIEKNITTQDIYIYSFWCTPHIYGAKLLQKKFSNITVLTRLHGYDIYAERSKINYMFKKFTKNDMSDIFIPCSRHGMAYLQGQGVAFNKIIVGYLGVPINENLAYPSINNEINLISCSSVIQVKRIELLLKSLINYAKKNKQKKINWYHIGDGPLLNNIKLETLKSPQNLYCHFLGNKTNKEVRNYYITCTHRIDGFVNVSESEGVPVSIMEAQMNGIPVLATDVGGVSEIITENTGVLLHYNFSQDEFNFALDELLNFSDIEVRKNIKERTQKLFSFNNYNLVVDLINKKKREV